MSRVAIVTGSPHREGLSLQLADAFEKGAQAAGNEVYRFDAGLQKPGALHFLRLEPGSPEVAKPDNDVVSTEVIPHLLKADVVALVSSLYYYGINAQLKTVIDRFYSYNHDLKDKKGVILANGYGTHEDMSIMMAHLEKIMSYMRWQLLGEVEVPGSWTPSNAQRGIQEAEKLGRSIR
jgi:multimeric flavodoxin WrbA